MRRETLFAVNTIYREHDNIDGMYFGAGERALAIVGALRGNEVQQLYICGQLVKILSVYEEHGLLNDEILVIPSINSFSMNVGKRFWAVDNSDINRMFPGYDKGETTQRVAARLFECIRGYKYGIQFTSFYMPGNFAPHARILDTGYHDTDLADLFGLPYVMVSSPKPVDTGTLNYNWQVFGTKAFSVYSKETKNIHHDSAMQAIDATLNFMASVGVLKNKLGGILDGYTPVSAPLHFKEDELVNVMSSKGGIFIPKKFAGDKAAKWEVLAEVLDPYTGELKEEIVSPTVGQIFFSYNSNLISGHETSFRLIPQNQTL
ncbi:hypothetical protein AGMMS49975_26520 [Clostridia bacterium]|nr:hypothetical protein AGMMS49975_26520 [Clostridia bacterium]